MAVLTDNSIQITDRFAIDLPAYAGADIAFVILGAVLLLFGWIIFKAGTRLLGVGLGAGFGFFTGEVLNVILKVDRDVGLLITIGTTAIGALASFIMLRAVTNFLFAFVGLLFGALLGRLAAEIHAGINQTEFIFSKEAGFAILGVAIITALLAVWLQRLIMILITSYMGATFLNAGVPLLYTYPAAFPGLIVAGILWQSFIMRRIFVTGKKRHEARPPAAQS